MKGARMTNTSRRRFRKRGLKNKEGGEIVVKPWKGKKTQGQWENEEQGDRPGRRLGDRNEGRAAHGMCVRTYSLVWKKIQRRMSCSSNVEHFTFAFPQEAWCEVGERDSGVPGHCVDFRSFQMVCGSSESQTSTLFIASNSIRSTFHRPGFNRCSHRHLNILLFHKCGIALMFSPLQPQVPHLVCVCELAKVRDLQDRVPFARLFCVRC